MPLTFNPDEIQEKKLLECLPDGTYGFKVIEAQEKISSSGNEMIELKLIIEAKDGTRLIYDYLVNSEKARFKIKQFCESTQMDNEFNSGVVSSENCLNKEGQCLITSEVDQRSGFNRNKIKSYLKSIDEVKTPEKIALDKSWENKPLNDDIPF